MKFITAFLLALMLGANAHLVSGQPMHEDFHGLRSRLEQRYDIVSLTNGIALRPKSRVRDVRLIEITDGAVAINGVVVTGRELRDRVGSDAEAILQVSYLSAEQQRELLPAIEHEPRPVRDTDAVERVEPSPPETTRADTPSADTTHRARRSSGDRVRVFGNVTVADDEEVTGQVVAVLGSVRVDGEVGDQVVAVLGSVDLGPSAVVHGDVVSVGGRVRRAEGSQTRGGVTEVSLRDAGVRAHGVPWEGDGWGPVPLLFGDWGAVPRLIGSAFRVVLLLLFAGVAYVAARGSVEAAAQRVSDSPVKVTVVGLIAEIMIVPVLVIAAVVMAISIIGIPLLLLLPFVVLGLLLLALVGFTGTAAAVGRAAQRRFALGGGTAFISVIVGILVILSPLLLGRIVALAGWPATPFAVVLVALGFALELLAWASGFGAMLTNGYNRWHTPRLARTTVATPPPA